ncbi:Helix-turn-helix domain-containing protein [Pseudobutyrivibrio xylanivorans]|uniref:Helix-turn-helix domain-containing protein n=2 Tax=Pseudobutyrivibrio xylanivorans TaxID=185007 RepID=A0A1G5S0J4_PSEXY|nr:Helix-turn-helix domain-containing protein [Pseudobutyrivibrio xylanivorans]
MILYPTIDKHETAKRLKKLMDDNGYSVKDIKEYLNLTCVQSVYHWLEEKSMPSVDNLYALSVLFNVTLDDMICGNRPVVIDDPKAKRLYRYFIEINNLKVA